MSHPTHPDLDFRTLQKVFLGVGAAALAVSVAMVFMFGWAMSGLHAVSLALVSIAVAFIFPALEFLRRMDMVWGARILTVVGVGFFCLELFAHVGYTVSQRTHSTDGAVTQTVAYDNRQEQLQSNKANLTMWREQLASLKSANAWAATVSADGLRSQITAADLAIAQESKRGGCGPRCLTLTQQKADIENRIAIAEQVTDLTKRIDATQRIIDKATDVAVDTKKGFSPVKAQTDFVSQIYLLGTTTDAEKALKPDNVTLTVSQILIGFMLALGMTVLSPAAFYIAFCKAEDMASALSATPAATEVKTPASASANGGIHVIERIVEGADDVRASLARIQQLRATARQQLLAA